MFAIFLPQAFRVLFDRESNVETFVVYQYRSDIRAHNLHHIAAGDMSRIFVPDCIARVEQNKCNENECLLSTLGDYDLFRVNLYAVGII
jgi:hypothetical protein